MNYTPPSNGTFVMHKLDKFNVGPWQLSMLAVYTITALVSVGSNGATIVMLFRRKHHDLLKYLVNLFVVDMVTALCFPLASISFLLGEWVLPNGLCSLIGSLQVVPVFVFVWTLVAMGMDRYCAIVHLVDTFWIRSFKMTFIAFIWLAGFVFAWPAWFFTTTVRLEHGAQGYDECRETFNHDQGQLYAVYLFICTYFTPILVLILIYSRIGDHLFQKTSASCKSQNQVRLRLVLRKKLKPIKMLLMLVILYALFWAPSQFVQLVTHFFPQVHDGSNQGPYYVYLGAYYSTHWLAMVHSLVNPIVYRILSKPNTITNRTNQH